MSTAALWRKKPVVIEAMRWDGTPEGATPIIDWILGHDDASASWSEPYEAYTFPDGKGYSAWPGGIKIQTLEGDMLASPGDWIIRGTKGEFYPCKPDVFADVYEPAEAVIDTETIAAVLQRWAGERQIGQWTLSSGRRRVLNSELDTLAAIIAEALNSTNAATDGVAAEPEGGFGSSSRAQDGPVTTPDLAAIRARVVRMLAVAAGGAEAAGEAEAGGLTDRAAGMRTKVYERHDAILGAYDELLAEVARLTGELAVRDHLSEDWHSAQRCGERPCPGCIIEDLIERVAVAEGDSAALAAERDALRAELAALSPAADAVYEALGDAMRNLPMGSEAYRRAHHADETERRRRLGAAVPPVPAASEPEADRPKLRCPQCGSARWVSVSLDEGYTRRAQCVPCGKVHEPLGPGWRSPGYAEAAASVALDQPSDPGLPRTMTAAPDLAEADAVPDERDSRSWPPLTCGPREINEAITDKGGENRG